MTHSKSQPRTSSMHAFDCWKVKLLLIVSLFSATQCFAETYVHEQTGLVFEDTIADLTKTAITNFENTKPGLGISVDYRATGKKLTIYVYNLRNKTISTDHSDSLVVANFRNAINDIFKLNPNVEMENPKSIPFQGKKSNSNWLMTTFKTNDANGRPLNSYLLNTTYKNFFVKLRYTYDLELKKEAESTGAKAFEYVAEQFTP